MKRILHFAAVAVLTIGLVALFVWNSNPRAVSRIIRSASPFWLVVALLTNWGALIFRTFRWRTILDPEHPPPFYPTFFANTIGYMVSAILRIPSDVARPVLLSRRTGHRISGAFGTVLTERILDLFSLLSIFVYFVGVHWNDWTGETAFLIIKTGGVIASTVMALLVLFIVGLYFFSGFVRRTHEWLGRFVPSRFRASWMHFFDVFIETLSLTTRPRALLNVLVCTAGIWACLTAQFWFVTVAFHDRLPYDWSFLANAITTLGLLIPTPGGVGGFHKTCQFVLTSFYNFDVDSSVATAIIIHLVGMVPVVVTGLILFVREGLHWRDVRDMKTDE